MTALPLEAKVRDPHAACQRLKNALSTVMVGKPEAIRLALSVLAARGHLLIEDVPGVGKTTLARAMARAIGGTFRRIQFTSDLLPSDILGVSVFGPESARFEFRPGPIFANVVLADEINRTTPRTQSSLLEAMSEGRVTIDGQTHDLGLPFMVIATQNPIEHFGTYPLPESQMDRFLMRIRLGYPGAAEEKHIVTSTVLEDPTEHLRPVVDLADVLGIQRAAAAVKVDDSLLDYAQRVVAETRRSPLLQLGVSPRGFQSWYRAAQAYAIIDGRQYTTPDDFHDLAIPALSHRLVTSQGGGDSLGQAQKEAERILVDLLDRVSVPT